MSQAGVSNDLEHLAHRLVTPQLMGRAVRRRRQGNVWGKSLIWTAWLMVAAALCRHAAAQEMDQSVIRVELDAGTLLVVPDASHLLNVWGAVTVDGVQREFVGTFVPEMVTEWLETAADMTRRFGRDARPPRYLTMPSLPDLDGGELQLTRETIAGQLSDPRLTFRRSDMEPLLVRISRSEAASFFTTLREAISRIEEGRELHMLSTMCLGNPGVSPGGPMLLDPPSPPRYPLAVGERLESAKVWLEYVVRRDGTLDSTQTKVLLSDHNDLTPAAYAVVRNQRFQPARMGGAPVDCTVFQLIDFNKHESRR